MKMLISCKLHEGIYNSAGRQKLSITTLCANGWGDLWVSILMYSTKVKRLSFDCVMIFSWFKIRKPVICGSTPLV